MLISARWPPFCLSVVAVIHRRHPDVFSNLSLQTWLVPNWVRLRYRNGPAGFFKAHYFSNKKLIHSRGFIDAFLKRFLVLNNNKQR
jgi:hypothetical protein